MENNSIKLSKIEIATYLKTYFELMFCATQEPNKSFFSLFSKFMQLNGTPQYVTQEHYDYMKQVYNFILTSNYFGIINDLNQFDLDEVKIEDAEIFQNIFVNKEDYKRFTKKQIIKYIRNAISHNDKDDRELYSIYRTGNDLLLEIKLQKVKPIPFHVRLNLEDYIKIMLQLEKSDHDTKIQVLLPPGINLRNYLYKLDEIVILYIDISDKVKNIKDKPNCIISSTKLSEEQKSKIIQLVKQYGDKFKNKFLDVLNYFVAYTIPLGAGKLEDMYFNLTTLAQYIDSGKNCLGDVIANTKKYDKNNAFNSILNRLDMGKYMALSLSVYFRYMLDTVITSEEIIVNSVTYPRNKLRNSFIHGRWFYGENANLELYDFDNSSEYKHDYNWHESIFALDLFKSMEQIYQKKLEEAKNTKQDFMNYPISFKFHEKTGEILHISFVKNSQLYMYNLNIKKEIANYLQWGLYIIDNQGYRLVKDPLEAAVFFNELKHLSFGEKLKYASIINILKSQYLQCLKYDSGLINAEELKENNYIVAKVNEDVKVKKKERKKQ